MSGALSAQYVYGVYVPSILVLAGCMVARPDMLPVAIAVVVGLAGYQILNSNPEKAAAATSTAKRAVANSAIPEKKDDGTVLTKTFQTFPLSEKKVISHNTAVYRFKLPTETSILGLPIGQHISVKANINGENVMRSYTPVTSDDDIGHFDLLVKSYPTGNISRLMGEMKIGDDLLFAGPKGAMVYTPNMMRHIGMIAGGTGITPMWQIVTAITKNRPEKGGNDKTEVDLIFANVNPEDILMKKELDDLAAKDKGFRVHYVLNNPPEGWKGGVGFVTPDIIKSAFPPPSSDTKVLICGPPPMVKAMKTATEGLGYEKARPVSKLPDQVFCF